MATYIYTAYNELGKEVKGELEAETQDLAHDIVAAKGLIPESIKPSSGSADSPAGALARLDLYLTPVRIRDLILFTKQFKTLIQAGVAMIQIFEILISQTENKKLKSVLSSMLTDVRGGAPLSKAFSKQGKVFSPLYCSMIQAGESSGSLPMVLDRLIYIIEHEHKVKSDIKSALWYPAIVVFLLVVVFIFLLTFLVPVVVGIFNRVGLDLPWPTKACLFMYHMLDAYWHVMLMGLAAAIIAGYKAFKTDTGRYWFDRMLIRMPLFGPLFVKTAMSRFASIFSILQASGVTVLESMDILSQTIANAAITREFQSIKELLTQGRGIAAPLKQARYFTPMVVNMTAIGEESGSLDDMLREIARHYDAEVEYATKTLSEAIGPILTISLAGLVGFFAMAIFLPMWEMTTMVK